MTFIQLLVVSIFELFVAITSMYIVKDFLQLENLTAKAKELKKNFADGKLLSAFFLMCVAAPIIEEFIFRYCLFDFILWTGLNFTFAIILSSAIFGMVHTSDDFLKVFPLPQFFAGIIFALVYKEFGYWDSVKIHAMTNGILWSVVVLQKAAK